MEITRVTIREIGRKIMPFFTKFHLAILAVEKKLIKNCIAIQSMIIVAIEMATINVSPPLLLRLVCNHKTRIFHEFQMTYLKFH